MIFLLCAELINNCLDVLKLCWVLKHNDFSAWFAVSEVLKVVVTLSSSGREAGDGGHAGVAGEPLMCADPQGSGGSAC